MGPWERIKKLARLIPLWLAITASNWKAYAWGEGGGDNGGGGGGGGETAPPEVIAMVNKILSLIQYIGVAVLIGGMIYAGIQLATADTPEEQARAKKRIGAILLAGAIMALAKPLIAWLTGLSL